MRNLEETEQFKEQDRTEKFIELDTKLATLDFDLTRTLYDSLEESKIKVDEWLQDVNRLDDKSMFSGNQVKALVNKVSNNSNIVGNSSGVITGYVSGLFELGIGWKETRKRVSLRFGLLEDKAEEVLINVYELLTRKEKIV